MKAIAITAAALLFSLLTAAVSPARSEALPATFITVNGNGGALTLERGGTAAETATGQRQLTPPHRATLARGRVPFAPGTWHTLALSVSGTAIVASVDGQQVASLTDATLTHGIPGIEVGGWYPAYFSNLTVTTP